MLFRSTSGWSVPWSSFCNSDNGVEGAYAVALGSGVDDRVLGGDETLAMGDTLGVDFDLGPGFFLIPGFVTAPVFAVVPVFADGPGFRPGFGPGLGPGLGPGVVVGPAGDLGGGGGSGIEDSSCLTSILMVSSLTLLSTVVFTSW